MMLFRHLGRSVVLSLLLATSVGSSAIAQLTPPPASTPEQKAFIEAFQTAKPAPVPPHTMALPSPTSPGTLETFDAATGHTTRTPRSTALTDPANTLPLSLPGSPGSAPLRVMTFPSETQDPAAPPLTSATELNRGRPRRDPRRITQPYNPPWAMVYKLLLRFTVNGTNVYYLCSASSLSSFHLLTAGQCVYNHDILGDGSNVAGWAQEVWAWPAQTDVVGVIGVPDFPYGVAKATHVHFYSEWLDDSDLNWDIAWIALDRRIGDHIGWMGMEVNMPTASLSVAGYPADGQYGFANNAFQYWGYHKNNVQSYADTRIYLSANVYGGEIGGPVWRYDGHGHFLQGVISTTDRMGNAAATRITNTILVDIQNSIATDEATIRPVPRPYFIEYSRQGNVSKGLLTPNVTAGGPATVTYNLYNAGFLSSSVTVSFYLSSTPQIDGNSFFVGSVPLGSVGANSYVVQNATLTIPSDTPAGSYYVVWSWSSSIAEYPTHYVRYYWGAGGKPPIDIYDDQAVITDTRLTVTSPF